jgi:para-nitrobenzyl esterase
VPVIESSTLDEWMMLGPPQVKTETALRSQLQRRFQAGQVNAIVSLYGGYAAPEAALVAVLSDNDYICPTRTDTVSLAAAQPQPVRRAMFSHTFESGPFRWARAGHGIDLFFGFHTFGSVPASAAELKLADTMVGYWTRFAATGDPNGGGAPFWPIYDANKDNSLDLDESIFVEAPTRKRFCDYWDWYYSG